jgi:hypothetical protein
MIRFILALFCVLPLTVGLAQTIFGSISRSVTDQTGSLIPKAK